MPRTPSGAWSWEVEALPSARVFPPGLKVEHPGQFRCPVGVQSLGNRLVHLRHGKPFLRQRKRVIRRADSVGSESGQ